MFQRFHEMREDREDGFTLIELLVVVLIIAILAAIAIPFFLNQRERSFESQAQSALKNAATAMESYASDNNGDYPAADTTLPLEAIEATATDDAQGFQQTDNAPLTIVRGGEDYCLQVNHANLDANWYYEADVGSPREGSCPAA